IEQVAKSEKKHREESTKRSFLDSSNLGKRAAAAHQVFGSEEQIAAEGKIDLSVAVTDTAIPKAKYMLSATFKQFITRLGGSAPISGAFKKNSNNPKDKK